MLEKLLEKSFFKVLTGIKFNSFQQKSLNTLSYASIGGQGYLSCKGNQYDITRSPKTMQTTTTNTCKNQKFCKNCARRKSRSFLNK